MEKQSIEYLHRIRAKAVKNGETKLIATINVIFLNEGLVSEMLKGDEEKKEEMSAEQEEIKVKEIRNEIFHLALTSPDIETMHWYMWLDDCFENDEFHPEELSSIKWRCMVLRWKEKIASPLLWKIDTLVKLMGYDLNDIEEVDNVQV